MMNVRKHGFSLIELVIAIAIIAIIAAIAVPRMSSASRGAGEAALIADLATMRRSLQLYYAEHGKYPKDKGTFAAQMTQYTDIESATSATKTATHIYGPYLAVIPPLPVGKNKGETKIEDGGSPGDSKAGWWYDKNKTGVIRAHLKDEEVDSTGKPYNQY